MHCVVRFAIQAELCNRKRRKAAYLGWVRLTATQAGQLSLLSPKRQRPDPFLHLGPSFQQGVWALHLQTSFLEREFSLCYLHRLVQNPQIKNAALLLLLSMEFSVLGESLHGLGWYSVPNFHLLHSVPVISVSALSILPYVLLCVHLYVPHMILLGYCIHCKLHALK